MERDKESIQERPDVERQSELVTQEGEVPGMVFDIQDSPALAAFKSRYSHRERYDSRWLGQYRRYCRDVS